MKKNLVNRRRGTSLAAAALSFALVAPFAQPIAAPQSAAAAYAGTHDEAGQPNAQGNGVKYPGENAEGVYQTGVGEPRYTVGDQPIKVEGAIESDVEAGSNNSIEGYVINQRNGNMSVHPGTNNLKPIPMEGVRIYAQWVERDGATSPIYTTTTGADGRFTIGMKSFVDSLGKVRKFDADPNLPEGEKFRIWAENPDPDAFTQLYGSGQGKLFPLGNTMELSAGMRNLVGSDRLENARFAFGEKAQNDVMHNLQASEENAPWKQPSVNAYGQVTGTVHWDLTRAATVAGWSDWVAYNKADVPAKGLKVYGSYLSDYAVGQILNEAPKDLGGKKIRGSGWSRDDEAALQNWIKRKIAEEGKDKWIAETTETTVGEDGDYVLQFKGTFGKAWDNRGYDDGSLIYTDLARDNDAEAIFPDGSKHKAYDLFNTVAPAADYGSWMSNASGRGGENLPKHINWDWLFVSTEDVDGAAVVTPFHTNAYTDKTNVNTDQTWAGVWNTVQAGRLANNNIALYSDYTVFDVLEYDTQQNYAKPGDTAETFTSGLPSKFVDGLKYEIEWVNTTTGEVVHKCEAQAAKGDTTIDSCPLDTGDKNLFPDGITQTTTFAANLYPVNVKTGERGNRIATDAFTVLVDWAPEYEPTEAKPGETKSSGAPTFDRTDTDEVEKLTAEQLAKQDPDKKPTKFELPEGFTVPEGYDVNVEEATGVVTVTFPAEDAKSIDVPVKVTYEDGSTATGKAPFTVAVDAADEFEPGYEDKLVVPGTPTESEPTFTDKDGKDTKAPEGSKFAISDDFEAPEGYTVDIDENTGVITVTAPKELNGDTTEEFDVPVTVTYPDGSTDKTDANFKLDTDGDGDPDVTDPDDDGDGIPDEEEEEKGSNPKDKGSIPATPLEPGNPTDAATLEPGYEDGSGKPGEDVTVPAPEFKDKDGNPTEAPDDTKFTPGDDAPEGVKVDENTGEITVPVPEDAKPGDKITVPVEVTYPDGSKDNVDVTVTVENPEAKTADEIEPGYEDGSGKPGEDVTVPAPEFKDKDGNPTEAPDDTKFTPGDDAPEGVKVDENTGEITVPVPEDAKPGDKITVPVEVTYPDGSKDNVDVTVTVENPEAKTADEIEPGYEDGSGKPGEDVTVPAPEFKDKDGNPTEAPDDTKFTPGDDAPEGVKVDENTGEITVPVPEDAKPGDKITVPVEVTYPDGSKDNVDVTVTVENPEAKTADEIEPGYEDGSGKPGEDVTVPAPEFKDKDGNPTEAPDDTKFTPGDDAPEGVKVDENTGEITVPVPEDAKSGDKITVPVEVTYPDGSKDNVDVTVTVENPEAKTADEIEPGYEDGSGKPGEDVTVPAPEFKDKDGNPTEAPDDTKFTPGDDAPEGVKVDENTGEITVPVPEDAKSGDKITVPVEVTYPDGSKDNVDVTVTVENPEAKTADEIEPGYEDGSGKPGEDVTVPAPEFKDKDGNPTEAPDDTKFTPGDDAPEGVKVDENTGEITVPVPEDAKPGDKITVPVEVTYPDGSKDTTEVTVTVEKPNPTDDEGEENPGEGPKDPETKPGDADKDTTPPVINEIKPGDKTVSGKGDRPGEEITVTFPGGKTVTTTTDENGNWKVDVPSGVELKPGDKVTATDGDGNKSTGTVGIDAGKCAATAVGFGLPLLALIPIGLATQMQIPGLSDFAAQANAQIQAANTQIQQQAGLFNPQLAAQVDAVNQQLGKFGADLGTLAGGLALIAAGILAGTLIYDNCSPNGGGSSVQDLELKGSSGKTYAGSSKEDKPAKQEGSSDKK